jgi:H+-translocating NAD(P) transhydrogenase subunit alpha
MKIAVLRETRAGESRVAATPETVKKFVGLGAAVAVERGAGDASNFPDYAYQEAGATIAAGAADALADADLVLRVRTPEAAEFRAYRSGQRIAAIVNPHGAKDVLDAAASAGVELFAMDLMPRITRAQSMDVLSSQSNLAGYKAVIDAAAYYGRAMPMMMTAAGTIAPAKVFIMGAGVAGLQAIATARRMGAVVSATDVRWAAKEQVESLGASFVTVDEAAMKEAETAGGYAKEMSEDFKRRQAEFVGKHIAKQNIVITTALIPGRPAPRLVSAEMVRAMAPGSVIVDLAVEQGGNVELSRRGEVIDVGGVIIVGFENVPGRLAQDASNLYARNLLNFVSAFVNKETKAFEPDWNDDIIKGVALTRDGKIVHPTFAPAPAAESGQTAAE